MLLRHALQHLLQNYCANILLSYYCIFVSHARLVIYFVHVIKSLHSQQIMQKDMAPCFIIGWTLTSLDQCFFRLCVFYMVIGKMLHSKAPSHSTLVVVTLWLFLMSIFVQVRDNTENCILHEFLSGFRFTSSFICLFGYFRKHIAA